MHGPGASSLQPVTTVASGTDTRGSGQVRRHSSHFPSSSSSSSSSSSLSLLQVQRGLNCLISGVASPDPGQDWGINESGEESTSLLGVMTVESLIFRQCQVLPARPGWRNLPFLVFLLQSSAQSARIERGKSFSSPLWKWKQWRSEQMDSKVQPIGQLSSNTDFGHETGLPGS